MTLALVVLLRGVVASAAPPPSGFAGAPGLCLGHVRGAVIVHGETRKLVLLPCEETIAAAKAILPQPPLPAAPQALAPRHAPPGLARPRRRSAPAPTGRAARLPEPRLTQQQS